MRHYIRFGVKCAGDEYNFFQFGTVFAYIEENDTGYEIF